MFRSLSNTSQITGSIFFFSSIFTILIFLPEFPENLFSSFELLYIGSIVSVIIITTNPVKWGFIQIIKRIVASQHDLDSSAVGDSLNGLFASGLVNNLIAKIYITLSLIGACLVFFFKSFPNSQFKSIINSNPQESLLSIVMVIILLIIAIGIFITTIIDTRQKIRLMSYLTIFEEYRRPVSNDYGYFNWLKYSERTQRIQHVDVTQHNKTKQMENYLYQWDYKSFRRSMDVQVIGYAKSVGYREIRFLLGPEFSVQISDGKKWYNYLKDLPNGGINTILESGMFKLSKTDQKLINIVNDITSIFAQSLEERLKDFERFARNRKEEVIKYTISADLKKQIKQENIITIDKIAFPPLSQDSPAHVQAMASLGRFLNQLQKDKMFIKFYPHIKLDANVSHPNISFKSVNFWNKSPDTGISITTAQFAAFAISKELWKSGLFLAIDDFSNINKIAQITDNETTWQYFREFQTVILKSLEEPFHLYWNDHKNPKEDVSLSNICIEVIDELKKVKLLMDKLKNEVKNVDITPIDLNHDPIAKIYLN